MIKLIPITTLKPHEKTSAKRTQKLLKQIKNDGYLYKPILIDKKTRIILDGHHRCKILKTLGYKKIPAYAIHYQSPLIKVLPRSKKIPVSKRSVVKSALEGTLLPYKSTRHLLKRRLPTINIKLNQLK